jgi:hypothetical protein
MEKYTKFGRVRPRVRDRGIEGCALFFVFERPFFCTHHGHDPQRNGARSRSDLEDLQCCRRAR